MDKMELGEALDRKKFAEGKKTPEQKIAEFKTLRPDVIMRRLMIAAVKEAGGTVKITADVLDGIKEGDCLEVGCNVGKGYMFLKVTEKSTGGIIIP